MKTRHYNAQALRSSTDPRFPILESERLVLRRLLTSDVGAAYEEWINSPEINRYLESRLIDCTRQDLENYVNDVGGDPRNLFMGIFLKEEGRHIGNIKLGPIDFYHLFGEVGVVIGDRQCWGRGYASEAIKLLSDYAFEKIGLHRLTAASYSENLGSIKAFERAGFAMEGVWKKQWFSEGKYQDGVFFGKVNPSV